MVVLHRSAESDKWRARLKEYRTRMGLSQGDLAKLLGLSNSAIHTWEAGHVHMEAAYASPAMKTVMEWLESYDTFVERVRAAQNPKGVLLVGGQNPPVRPKFTEGMQRIGLLVRHVWDANPAQYDATFPADVTLVVVIQPSCPSRFVDLLHQQGRTRNIPVVNVPDQWSQAQKILLGRNHGHAPTEPVEPEPVYPALPVSGWVVQAQLAQIFKGFDLPIEEVLAKLPSPTLYQRLPGLTTPAWPMEAVQGLLDQLYQQQEDAAALEAPQAEPDQPTNVETVVHAPMPVTFREAPTVQPVNPEPHIEVPFVETIDQTVSSLQDVQEGIDKTKTLHAHLEEWASWRVSRAVQAATEEAAARLQQTELELDTMRELLDAARQHNRKLEDMLAAVEMRKR